MKFLHMADVHLGKYAYTNSARYQDLFDAFASAVQYGIQQEIDVLLVAGDLFDIRNVNSQILFQTIRILERLKQKNIPVLAIEGNHDRALLKDGESWLAFLDNLGYLKLLSTPKDVKEEALPKEAVYETETYRVVGLSYLGAATQKTLEGLRDPFLKADKFTIFMLHAGLSMVFSEEMAKLDKKVLLEYGDKVQYFALGHIHRQEVIADKIYMPGSLEYIDMGEARRGDQKGFFLGEVDERGQCQVQFCPSHTRHYESVKIDASSAQNGGELFQMALSQIEASQIPCHSIVDVELTAENPSFDFGELDTAALESALTELLEPVELYVHVPGSYEMTYETEPLDTFDKKQLERQVVLDLLLEEKKLEEHSALALTNLALEAKDLVYKNEFQAQWLVDEVLQMAETMQNGPEEPGQDLLLEQQKEETL